MIGLDLDLMYINTQNTPQYTQHLFRLALKPACPNMKQPSAKKKKTHQFSLISRMFTVYIEYY